MVKEIILDEFPTHVAYTNNTMASNKYIKVNNQSIYNGKLNRFSRAIAVKNLHEFVKSKIPDGCCIIPGYPIKVQYIIYTVKNHGSISRRAGRIIWKEPESDYKPNWDIDNLAFLWIKTINDTLVSEGVIDEDNVQFVVGGNYETKFIKHLEDRKIIIKFIK